MKSQLAERSLSEIAVRYSGQDTRIYAFASKDQSSFLAEFRTVAKSTTKTLPEHGSSDIIVKNVPYIAGVPANHLLQVKKDFRSVCKGDILIPSSAIQSNILYKGYSLYSVREKKEVIIPLFDLLDNYNVMHVSKNRDFVTTRAATSAIFKKGLSELAASEPPRRSVAVTEISEYFLGRIIRLKNLAELEDTVKASLSGDGTLDSIDRILRRIASKDEPTELDYKLLPDAIREVGKPLNWLIAVAAREEMFSIGDVALENCNKQTAFIHKPSDLLTKENTELDSKLQKWLATDNISTNTRIALAAVYLSIIKLHKESTIVNSTKVQREANALIFGALLDHDFIDKWIEDRNGRALEGRPLIPLDRYSLYQEIQRTDYSSSEVDKGRNSFTLDVANRLFSAFSTVSHILGEVNTLLNERAILRNLLSFNGLGLDASDLHNNLANLVMFDYNIFMAITRRSARNALKRSDSNKREIDKINADNKIRAKRGIKLTPVPEKLTSPFSVIFWEAAAEVVVREMAWGFYTRDWKNSLGKNTDKHISAIAKAISIKFMRTLLLSDLDVRSIFNVWSTLVYSKKDDGTVSAKVLSIDSVDKFTAELTSVDYAKVFESIRDKEQLVKEDIPIFLQEWKLWEGATSNSGIETIIRANPKAKAETLNADDLRVDYRRFEDFTNYCRTLFNKNNLQEVNNTAVVASKNPAITLEDLADIVDPNEFSDDLPELEEIDLDDIQLVSDLDYETDYESAIINSARGQTYFPSWIEKVSDFAVLLEPTCPEQRFLSAEEAQELENDVNRYTESEDDEQLCVLVRAACRLALAQFGSEREKDYEGCNNADLPALKGILDIFASVENNILALSASGMKQEDVKLTLAVILNTYKNTQLSNIEKKVASDVLEEAKASRHSKFVQLVKDGILTSKDLDNTIISNINDTVDKVRRISTERAARAAGGEIRVRFSPIARIKDSGGYDNVGRVQIRVVAKLADGTVNKSVSLLAINAIGKILSDTADEYPRFLSDGNKSDDPEQFKLLLDDFSEIDLNRIKNSLELSSAFGKFRPVIEIDSGVVALKGVFTDDDGKLKAVPTGYRPVMLQWIEWNEIPGYVSVGVRDKYRSTERSRNQPRPLIVRTFSNSTVSMLADGEQGADVNRAIRRLSCDKGKNNYEMYGLPKLGHENSTETYIKVVLGTTWKVLNKAISSELKWKFIIVGELDVKKESSLTKVRQVGPEFYVEIDPKINSYEVPVALESSTKENKKSTLINVGDCIALFGAGILGYRTGRVSHIRHTYGRLLSTELSGNIVNKYLDSERLLKNVVKPTDEDVLKVLPGSPVVYEGTGYQKFTATLKNLGGSDFRKLNNYIMPIAKYYPGDIRSNRPSIFKVNVQYMKLFLDELVNFLVGMGLSTEKGKEIYNVTLGIRKAIEKYVINMAETTQEYIKLAVEVDPVKPDSVNLLPYQVEGCKFLYSRRNAILADDRGLGKTIQAIIAAETVISSSDPVVVIVPAPLRVNFAVEVNKFAINKKACIVDGVRSGIDTTRVRLPNGNNSDVELIYKNDPLDIQEGNFRWIIVSMDLIKRSKFRIRPSEPIVDVDTALDVINTQLSRKKDSKTSVFSGAELRTILTTERISTLSQIFGEQGTNQVFGNADNRKGRGKFRKLNTTLFYYYSYLALVKLSENSGSFVGIESVVQETYRLLISSNIIQVIANAVGVIGVPQNYEDTQNLSNDTLMELLKKVLNQTYKPADFLRAFSEDAGGILSQFCDSETINTPLVDYLINTNWRLTIFDEAHAYKNRKSRRYKLAARLMQQSDRSWFLTGTPMAHKVEDLWTLLKLVHHPLGAGDDESDFIARYGAGDRGSDTENGDSSATTVGSKGITKQAELKKFTQDVLLWRYKDDVADIPPQAIETKKVMLRKMIAELSKAGGDLELGDYGWISASGIDDSTLAVLLPILKDYWTNLGKDSAKNVAEVLRVAFDKVSVDTFGILSTAVIGAMRRIQDIVGRLKAPFTLVEALNSVRGKEKVIIFCNNMGALRWFEATLDDMASIKRRPLTPMEAALVENGFDLDFLETVAKNYVSVYGGTPKKLREEHVSKFTTTEACSLFIGNIVVAGTGLNLQAATVSIFNDVPDKTYLAEQAEDRTRRIGQERASRVVWMVSDADLDESTYKVLRNRRSLIEIVQEGRDAPDLFKNTDVLATYAKSVGIDLSEDDWGDIRGRDKEIEDEIVKIDGEGEGEGDGDEDKVEDDPDGE